MGADCGTSDERWMTVARQHLNGVSVSIAIKWQMLPRCGGGGRLV